MRLVLRLAGIIAALTVGLAARARPAAAQSADAGATAATVVSAATAPPDDDPDDQVPDAGPVVPPLGVRVDALCPDASAPIATGRGLSVTAGELYRRIADAPEPVQRQWAADPRLLDALVDRLVADRLLADEARRQGLEQDPAVRAAVERALVARLRATVITPAAGAGASVSPDEIQAFYAGHPSRFHVAERRRARLVFVADRRTAGRILRLALATRRRRGGPPEPVHEFRALAVQYNSDPELVRTAGEVRDVLRAAADLDPALVTAIYALRAPGDVGAAPVPGRWRGARGYFLVRLSSRRAAIDRTLAESSDWIRQRVVLERRVEAERQYVTRLAQNAGVVRAPLDHVVRVTAVDVDAGAGPP